MVSPATNIVQFAGDVVSPDSRKGLLGGQKRWNKGAGFGVVALLICVCRAARAWVETRIELGIGGYLILNTRINAYQGFSETFSEGASECNRSV